LSGTTSIAYARHTTVPITASQSKDDEDEVKNELWIISAFDYHVGRLAAGAESIM
jgi:hypothetical protein